MSQKRNPVSLRLQTRLHGQEKRFACSWFTELFYPQLCAFDIQARLYLGQLVQKGRGWSMRAYDTCIPETNLHVQFSYRRCCIFSVILNKDGEESDCAHSMNLIGEKENTSSSFSRFDREKGARGLVRNSQDRILSENRHTFSEKSQSIKDDREHLQSSASYFFLSSTNELRRVSQNHNSNLSLTFFLISAKRNAHRALTDPLSSIVSHPLLSLKQKEKGEIKQRKDCCASSSWIPFKKEGYGVFSIKRACVSPTCFPFLYPTEQLSHLPILESALQTNKRPPSVYKERGKKDLIAMAFDRQNRIKHFSNEDREREMPCGKVTVTEGVAYRDKTSENLQNTLSRLSFLQRHDLLLTNKVAQNKEISWSPRTHISYSLFLLRALSISQSIEFCLHSIIFLYSKRQSFQKIQEYLFARLACNEYIKGARLLCSGRLGGRSKTDMRSKKHSAHFGETSYTVFSSKLAFACTGINTSFGKIGIKLWICYH